MSTSTSTSTSLTNSGLNMKNTKIAKRHKKLNKSIDFTGSKIFPPKRVKHLHLLVGAKQNGNKKNGEIIAMMYAALLEESVVKAAYVSQNRAKKQSTECTVIQPGDVQFVLTGSLYPEYDEFQKKKTKKSKHAVCECMKKRIKHMQEAKERKRLEAESASAETD